MAKVFSSTFHGLECHIIEVEADISSGLPGFNIVGLGDASVHESRERVRASIKNSGLQYPPNRKTINLAPAEIRKQGSLLDLPIAVSLLLASGQMRGEKLRDALVIGELSLKGEIKSVHGVLPIVHTAALRGFKRIYLPKANAREASFIEGVEVYPVENLRDFVAFCEGKIEIAPHPASKINPNLKTPPTAFLNIFGLEKEKRALVIAAAGGHNLLLTGSPGCGKTVLCRSFSALQTSMTKREVLETTKIFSISGLLNQKHPIVIERPFREVHHTASVSSVIGGGSNPKPGEISLAHNGTIFFDEIAEFPRQVLEALRQPLEDKHININRIHCSVKFPSNFLLLATMNPCPCGYHEDKKIPCVCTATQIQHYQKKISGPLLDRFDIFLRVHKSPIKNFFDQRDSQKQINHLEQIENARKLQLQRFKKEKFNISQNANMSVGQIRKFCQLDEKSQQLLNHAVTNLQLSNRAYFKTLKLARTIADLAGSEKILAEHFGESLQYRR